MPLFAVLHIDVEGLHPHSCTVVEADSFVALAESMLNNPNQWYPLLHLTYPVDDDPRSLFERIEQDHLTPQQLLKLIVRSACDGDRAEMLRIHPITIQSLDQISVRSRWYPTFSPYLEEFEENSDQPNKEE